MPFVAVSQSTGERVNNCSLAAPRPAEWARKPGKSWLNGEFLPVHYDQRPQGRFSATIALSSPVPDDFRPSLVPGSGSHPTLGVKQKHRQPAQLPVQLRLGPS